MSRENSSERYVLIESLYQRAADLAPEQRAGFLSKQCPDEGIRNEVAALLRHHYTKSSDFLDRPAGGLSDLAEMARLPERIGGYEVTRVLGEGGMGVVYEARQDRPARSVAVKLIRPGVSSTEALRRFELEAAVLGRLQHPGIAHIYEAGIADVTWTGETRVAQPFFAMELIEGAGLREHVVKRGLDTRRRLMLFGRVCDAVQHAHQKGVIHRDLKPGNILITSDGQPKVLDFGVARVTDGDARMTTMHTGAAQIIGTISYMSPEQVEGRVDELDTRSDVYALGVILYELLTGVLPYELADLTIAQAARVICERPPTPLALRDRALAGDLTTIAGKALEKEPARRYASVSALAADIERYLRHEPIAARPASAAYTLRRFAQRNKALVGGICATFVALAVAVAGTTYGMLEAARQRDEAEAQRDEAQLQASIVDAVNDFLTEDVLEAADPQNEPDRELTLGVVLDRASERIGERFADAPLVEAEIRKTIGKAYSHLNEFELAERHLSAALELFRTERGPDDEDALLCQMELAAILMDLAENDRAFEMFTDLLARQRDVLGEDHEQTIASLHNLATIHLFAGRFEAAEPLLLGTLEARLRVLGEDNTHTAVTMNNLGVLYGYTDRQDEALDIFERALDIHMRVSGEEHPDTLQTLANVAGNYAARQRNEEAAGMFERSLETHRRVYGNKHRDTLTVAGNLAAIYGRLGRHEERETLLRDTLAGQLDLLGPSHLDTFVTRLNLAKSTSDKGETEAAAGQYGALAADFAEHHPTHFLAGVANLSHGKCLQRLERLEEAEAAMLEGHRILLAAFGEGNPNTNRAVSDLVELYEEWGKPEAAEEWRARMPDSEPSSEADG